MEFFIRSLSIAFLLAVFLMAGLPIAGITASHHVGAMQGADANSGMSPRAATSQLTLSSSSQYLVDAFNWNMGKALSWVRTGEKPGYIPCYWAGYNYREAFYVRDVAHQCEGAALLGLNNENFNIWRAFAGTATSSRQWFCLWALDFYGRTYPVDYLSDARFVREIPAPLELVDKALACYQWSADKRWLADPILTRFYRTTMNDFIARHDDNGDGIAEGHFVDIFDGPCGSYCEQSAGGYGVGGDNIAITWSAYNAYDRLLRYMGRGREAGAYKEKAAAVKRIYDKEWWDASRNNYYAGRTIGLKGWITDFDQYSKETYDFQATKRLAEPGPKANAMLDVIHENYLANRKNYNFESFTYLPEAFYNYGMNERGWHWLKCIMDSHYQYPEVSYTAVASVATGLMGIEPDAPHHRIATLGRLTDEVDWVQLDHIPLGTNDVLVRHGNGNRETTVRNNAGPEKLTWEARLTGSHRTLLVDGVVKKAKHQFLNGVEVSSVVVVVKVGQQKTVTAVATPASPIVNSTGPQGAI